MFWTRIPSLIALFLVVSGGWVARASSSPSSPPHAKEDECPGCTATVTVTDTCQCPHNVTTGPIDGACDPPPECPQLFPCFLSAVVSKKCGPGGWIQSSFTLYAPCGGENEQAVSCGGQGSVNFKLECSPCPN
jgi:hypothetical protein